MSFLSIKADRCATQSSDNNDFVAQPISTVPCSIPLTAIDSPHVCQRCSGTFVLASSLRTHAAHVHGEELQASPAENGCHPSGGSGNHGDTSDDLKPQGIIKIEVFEADDVQSNALRTDSETQVVGDIHGKSVSDICFLHNDTAVDIVKRELSEVDSVESSSTVLTDTEERVVISDRHCRFDRDTSYTHAHGNATDDNSLSAQDDTLGDKKQDTKEREVNEIHSNHSSILLTDTQAQTDCDVHNKAVSEIDELNLKVNPQKTDVCNKVDLKQPNNQTLRARGSHVGKKSYNSASNLTREKKKITKDRSHTRGVCEKSFTHSSALILHKKIHSEHELIRNTKKAYTCNVCKKMFTQRSCFMTHKRIHINDTDRIYVCKVCGKTFVRSHSFRKHEKSHTADIPLDCKTCGKAFKTPKYLKVHEKTHRGERPHVGKTCGKAFSRKYYLKRHTVLIHTGDSDGPYACKDCELTFKVPGDLMIHERIHTADSPRQIHTADSPHVCEVCGKSFGKRYNLKTHERSHTSNRPFVCKDCGKAFKTSKYLNIHEQIHSGYRPLVCNVCGKTFRRPFALQIHERVHTGDRPFICEVCGKTFKTRANLFKHERIHTGHKPNACRFCTKTFYFPSKLKIHERIHTGEKPYACKVCNKTFKTSGDVKTHERIHDRRKSVCKICGKTFTNNDSFRRHERTHLLGSGYVCKFCNKIFGCSSSLNRHIRSIHPGDTLYTCKICEKAFTSSNDLKVHETIHSEELFSKNQE